MLLSPLSVSICLATVKGMMEGGGVGGGGESLSDGGQVMAGV